MSRIEQVIMEMEEYVESCKPQAFSNSKIIVDKATLLELISELRLKTPDEIKKYKKIINSKDAIIADAREQAENIIAKTQAQKEQLINEHEIMRRAVASANEYVEQAQYDAQNIIDQATIDANEIRAAAVAYTDDMMANLQMILEHTIDTSRYKMESMLHELNNSLDIIVSNRNELRPKEEPKEMQADAPQIVQEPELTAPDLNIITEEADRAENAAKAGDN